MDFCAAADRIKELAAEKGVSVRKMLLELGLSANYITQFRTAKHMPTKINLIADYLGVSVDYLLGTEPPAAAGEEVDERYVRLVNAVRQMSPEQVDAWLALLEKRAGQ